MTKHKARSLLLILVIGIALGFLGTNYLGDITEHIKDKAKEDVMREAFEDLTPAEGEAPEVICPAKMQAEGNSEDGIYILIKTKNHEFEINF